MKIRLILFLFLFVNILSAQVIDEGFESGDLSSYPWELSGDAEWFVSDEYPFEGDYCAEGGNINDNQTTSIGITIENTTTGILSFAWKVSSEANYDYFRFYLDEVMVAEIEGTVGWTQVGYQLVPGEHTLRWSYEKDVSVSNGSDTGWLDNVLFYTDEQEEFDFDLEVLSIEGPSHLQGGGSYNYDVTVRNCGQFNLTGYTVSLIDGIDTEYASETIFWMLAPGEENTVELVWEPDIAFPDSVFGLYGKGSVSQDENPENNYSIEHDIHIIPAEYEFSMTGSDDLVTNQIPFSFIWKTSIMETIYFEDELPDEGLITSIDIFNQFTFPVNNKFVSLWLGSTEQQSLVDGWISSDSLQQVFSGEIDFPQGENIINIEFEQPYVYTGGNLAVIMLREFDYTWHTWASYFKYSVLEGSESGRTRYDHSDLHEYDTTSMEGGILCDWVANTVFTFEPLSSEKDHLIVKPSALFAKISPNPFNPSLARNALNIEVNAECGDLYIYDIKGRKIKSLQVNDSGIVSWDGNDDHGKRAASGVYLLRLKTSDQTAAAKMMLLR